MRMRHGVLVVLAGITASAYVWGWYSDSELDRERHALAAVDPAGDGSSAETIAQHRPRVFSAKDPVLAEPHLPDIEAPPQQAAPAPRRWATVTTVPRDDAVQPRRTGSSSSRNLTSLKPGDPEARAQLVRDIQYELKRVGCYAGEVSGSWTGSTKQAMRLFTDRVNASLPIEEPDYVLLTLVQNEKPGMCGRECPEGQLASEDGRCMPRAIVAQRGGRKNLTAGDLDVARSADGSDVSHAAPLPGRMGVGAVLDGRSTGADAVVPQAGLAGSDANGRLDAAQPAEHVRRNAAPKRPRIVRGSTRQVFSNLTRFAP